MVMRQRPWIIEIMFKEAREDKSNKSRVVCHRYSRNGFSVFPLICLFPINDFPQGLVNIFFFA